MTTTEFKMTEQMTEQELAEYLDYLSDKQAETQMEFDDNLGE
jgi:hypothetical protein